MTVTTQVYDEDIKPTVLDAVLEILEDLLEDQEFYITVVDRAEILPLGQHRLGVKQVLREVIDAVEALNY